jgi:hypothetical protein
MDALVEKLDTKLRTWKPETAQIESLAKQLFGNADAIGQPLGKRLQSP